MALRVETLREAAARVRAEAGRVLVGPLEIVDLCLLAMIVGGHVLLEGVPGTVVYNQQTAAFEVRPGPIFSDIVLADEVNRSPARTQAALLEAMEEKQVTLDNRRHPLGDRFMVIATQNPIEYEGTYPLPEAQLDRFLVKLEVPYLPIADEAVLARRVAEGFDPNDLSAIGTPPVVDAPILAALRREVGAVRVEDPVLQYAVAIVDATRHGGDLSLGASPRGTVALVRLGQAAAALAGRDYCQPEDVKGIAVAALRHRVLRRPEAEIQGVGEVTAIERALARVPVPR